MATFATCHRCGGVLGVWHTQAACDGAYQRAVTPDVRVTLTTEAARALAVVLGVDDTDPAQLMREAAARLDRDREIRDLIEASSLGTPEAKALRDSVSEREGRMLVRLAEEIDRNYRLLADNAVMREELRVMTLKRAGEYEPGEKR